MHRIIIARCLHTLNVIQEEIWMAVVRRNIWESIGNLLLQTGDIVVVIILLCFKSFCLIRTENSLQTKGFHRSIRMFKISII